MDRIPGWVQVLVLLVIIAGTAVFLYKWATKDPWDARNKQKREWEQRQATEFIKPLKEKGEQRIGTYLVKARHVEGLEFADVTIQRKSGDTVTQEIKADRMTVEIGNDETCRVGLSGVTVTKYDEEGTGSTEAAASATVFFTNSVRGPVGIMGPDWAARSQPRM